MAQLSMLSQVTRAKAEHDQAKKALAEYALDDDKTSRKQSMLKKTCDQTASDTKIKLEELTRKQKVQYLVYFLHLIQ